MRIPNFVIKYRLILTAYFTIGLAILVIFIIVRKNSLPTEFAPMDIPVQKISSDHKTSNLLIANRPVDMPELANQPDTIAELRKEIEELKKRKPQTIIKEVAPKQKDLAVIIEKWKPRIAHIYCDFKYRDGDSYLFKSGSGTLFKMSDGSYWIYTNRHVITDYNGYGPNICSASLSGNDDYIFFFSTDTFVSGSGVDWGSLKINIPSEYVKSVANTVNALQCKNKPSIGDGIVVLGYPIIGSISDITATEGIVSGIEGDYYVTSAKIEQGNSGGAAILVKDDCFLGIPTFAQTGNIESLARVLDIKAIYK